MSLTDDQNKLIERVGPVLDKIEEMMPGCSFALVLTDKVATVTRIRGVADGDSDQVLLCFKDIVANWETGNFETIAS